MQKIRMIRYYIMSNKGPNSVRRVGMVSEQYTVVGKPNQTPGVLGLHSGIGRHVEVEPSHDVGRRVHTGHEQRGLGLGDILRGEAVRFTRRWR